MIRRDRTAMANSIQPGKGCLDDVAARAARGVGDEADSARIVLESVVVKTRASHSGPVNLSRSAASFHG